MRKYKLLNSITGLNVGGAEMMLARYARSLLPTAFEPQVLSLMAPGVIADLLAADGIAISTLQMRQSRVAIASIGRLRKMVSRAKPDLLHGWMYHGNFAASLGSFLDRRQPVVWSIHHSVDDISHEKRPTRWLIHLLAMLSKRVAAISYCSRVSADQHEALGFDGSNRVIIPNGIDCDVFQPDLNAHRMLRHTFGIPASRIVIGNVARAHPMKDHRAFVRTLALLRDGGLDVHGIIIGAGHENGQAKQLAKELGMADRLSTPGPLDEIHKVLPGLDAFMLSSAWGEAFPLSVAEAMACGVPVVATNVGDCSWLIGDRDLVTAPSDPLGQATALRRVFALQPDERRQLGLRGRTRVRDNFSLRAYTERHLSIYESVIANRSRSGFAS